jgi:hypothetical protein
MVKKTILLLAFYISSISAQFKFENFINESFDNDLISIKEQIKEKKFEEKENKGIKSITYYDWVNPISIKVGYIFDKEGKQKGRMILNGKENETESKKAFEIFKKEIIKIFGKDFSEMNMFGATILQWKNLKEYKVILSRKDNKTAFFITKN